VTRQAQAVHFSFMIDIQPPATGQQIPAGGARCVKPLDGPGASAIDSILLYGHHHHTISGMNVDAIVVERTYQSGRPYIYSGGSYNWPHGSINEIESIIGAPITAFVGAYSASEFLIEANTVPEPNAMFLLCVGLLCVFLRRKSPCPKRRLRLA